MLAIAKGISLNPLLIALVLVMCLFVCTYVFTWPNFGIVLAIRIAIDIKRANQISDDIVTDSRVRLGFSTFFV